MPDDRNYRHNLPHNWSDAFAALPLETPPHDVWAKIAAQLHSHPRRQRRRQPLWMALAAAVVLAVALPLVWRGQEKTPSLAVIPATESSLPSSVHEENNKADNEMADVIAVAADTPPHPNPLPRKQGRGSRSALDALYAQSAQLENLLAQVRDERVASGPAAALTDQLETRIALIDATLSDPTLDNAQRTGLWRERVDALQQLASFQSTQRLLAAQGERYDGQLIAVY